ncbi:MAG: hypothetical protein K0S65_1349 [Labilithrix sp.]|nr:hypothetical protein [Labilithrix sp.]
MKPEWLDAFTLDDQPSPAAPLRRDQADAWAIRAVDRTLKASSAGGMSRLTRRLLLVAGLGGGLTTLAMIHSPWREAPLAHPAPSAVATPRSEASTSAVRSPPVQTVSVDDLPSASPEPKAPVVRQPGPPPPAKSDREIPPEAASDLLADANRLRATKDWARAAALYERVMSSTADESYAATVALASLRLEHFDDARGALALYERALSARPTGTLSAQARSGIERCRRALGNEDRSPR